MKPAAVAAAIVALLTAAEGRPPDESLADAARTFPTTGRHLAQLFDLDSLRATTSANATRITLGLTFRPDRLRARYPFFAAFVSRYVEPTVYRARLGDAAGRTFMDVAGRRGQITVTLRSHNHRLVAVDGAPVPMPDTLRLLADVSVKTGPFRVGFTDLDADFIIERTEHYRAWVMRFRKEPAWHFPLAVDKLIKVPLRRPFRGRGAEFTLGVRDDLGQQTMSIRHTRLVVSESAIMRWLGRLGGRAFGEFSGRTEVEENLFLYEMFEALRRDVKREDVNGES